MVSFEVQQIGPVTQSVTFNNGSRVESLNKTITTLDESPFFEYVDKLGISVTQTSPIAFTGGSFVTTEIDVRADIFANAFSMGGTGTERVFRSNTTNNPFTLDLTGTTQSVVLDDYIGGPTSINVKLDGSSEGSGPAVDGTQTIDFTTTVFAIGRSP